jgi:hypothetical protein
VGSGGTAPCVLGLGTGWNVSGPLRTVAILPLEREPSVPVGCGTSWAPEPLWTP